MPTLATVNGTPREILSVEEAVRQLEICRDLNEIRDIRDKAEALRLYLRKSESSLKAQNEAAQIAIEAKCRIGEVSRELDKNTGGRPKNISTKTSISKIQVLADAGISRLEASICETMAALPKEQRRAAIKETKEAGRELTSKAIYQAGRKHKQDEAKKTEAKAKGSRPQPPDPTWQIIQANCLDVLGHPSRYTPPKGHPDPLETRPRLIFADPPYNEGIDYGDHYNDQLDDGDYRDQARRWFECFYDALTDDGALWLLINHEWAYTFCADAEECGFYLHQTVIWFESFGVNCSRKFNRCSRPLLWLVKDSKRFVFNSDAPEVRRPSDRQAIYKDKRAEPDGKLWDDVWGVNPPVPRLAGTHGERRPEFPTQLPLALLRPIVACASNLGDLVIDPFSGSGTTGHACIELGRRFIGIELSQNFAELSRLRLQGVR
jgi:site-specific DNA-methyltransferase (adenine-specific)